MKRQLRSAQFGLLLLLLCAVQCGAEPLRVQVMVTGVPATTEKLVVTAALRAPDATPLTEKVEFQASELSIIANYTATFWLELKSGRKGAFTIDIQAQQDSRVRGCILAHGSNTTDLMEKDAPITVPLVPQTYAVVTKAEGPGSISGAPIGSIGACGMVTLTPSARDRCAEFTEWSSTCDADSQAPQCKVAITGDLSITASFKQLCFINVQGEGTVSGKAGPLCSCTGSDCTKSCPIIEFPSASQTLIASSVRSEPYFVAWSGACDAMDLNCRLTTQTPTVTAIFSYFESVQAPVGTASTLQSVWGSGPDDVWAVGDAGTILHWDGQKWMSQKMGMSSLTATLRGVAGTAPTDVWAVGPGVGNKPPPTVIHWNGTSWESLVSLLPLGIELNAVWASSSTSVWVVGTGGKIYQWNSATKAWSDSTPLLPGPQTLNSVWGWAVDDVWAVGDGGKALHWVKAFGESTPRWNSVTTGLGTAKLTSVWGSSASDVWAVSKDTIFHWTSGLFWTPVPVGPNRNLTSIWAQSANDAWAVGMNTILRWDGTNWRSAQGTTTGTLQGLWGDLGRAPTDLKDVWAVGTSALTLHYKGL